MADRTVNGYGLPYPRTHGHVTSPAQVPDSLPTPEAAKHRGVPFAHVGRFPARSVRSPIVARISES